MKAFRIADVVQWILAVLASVMAVAVCFRDDNPLAGKVILIAVAVIFWFPPIMILIWRYRASRCDFVTQRGLRVRVGKRNRPTLSFVQAIEEEFSIFWTAVLDRVDPADVLEGRMVVFVDAETMSVLGRYVRGYATGTHAVIGYTAKGEGSDWEVIGNLLRHELGHWAAEAKLGIWDESTHHEMVKHLGWP